MTDKKRKEMYMDYKAKVMENLDMGEPIFNFFKKQGEKLNKIYTDFCNGDITLKQEKKLTAPIYKKLDAFAHLLGYSIYYQTDPRGATIYVSKKEVLNDINYTNGVCIY